jgi:hypothetical protein
VISGQGDTFPSQETSVYTRDNSALWQCKKGYKNPVSNLTTGLLVSGFPCIPHYTVFLFSPNKIFPTSAADACAFILRAGSRTLSS